jgi:hypothetical protein
MLKNQDFSPLVYDKNRKTFMLILSTLIGLLYLMAMAGNGIRGFINGWTTDPNQECYIIVPYNGNAAQLKIDTIKVEEYLKKSSFKKCLPTKTLKMVHGLNQFHYRHLLR